MQGNANTNAEAGDVAPPPTRVQGVGSRKKISDIRDWTKEDMLKAIHYIEFNGYSVKEKCKEIWDWTYIFPLLAEWSDS